LIIQITAGGYAGQGSSSELGVWVKAFSSLYFLYKGARKSFHWKIPSRMLWGTLGGLRILIMSVGLRNGISLAFLSGHSDDGKTAHCRTVEGGGRNWDLILWVCFGLTPFPILKHSRYRKF
jgi:hypothetical protein